MAPPFPDGSIANPTNARPLCHHWFRHRKSGPRHGSNYLVRTPAIESVLPGQRLNSQNEGATSDKLISSGASDFLCTCAAGTVAWQAPLRQVSFEAVPCNYPRRLELKGQSFKCAERIACRDQDLAFVGNETFGKYLQRNADRHRAINIQSNWSGACEYLKSVARQRWS